MLNSSRSKRLGTFCTLLGIRLPLYTCSEGRDLLNTLMGSVSSATALAGLLRDRLAEVEGYQGRLTTCRLITSLDQILNHAGCAQ